jgi:iron complex outermembrane recepter protein
VGKTIRRTGAGARRAGTPTGLRATLVCGCLAALLPLSGALAAQGSSTSVASEDNNSSTELETVVVTGSLIPQSKLEQATPLTVITAEDMQARGFTSVADALQQTSFATGAIQNGQFSGGFTQGAQTLSLFGLSPSYTKYLIDGRPMSDYPALYNGTDNFVSISGVPIELVDHIDVLPGGQSSIYGSDAIAGVINIVLKKKLDGPLVDIRYGWTQDGGGTERRFAVADGFNAGSFNLMGGIQYEKTDPIWGYQRDLTNKYFTQGTSPQTAERDYLVYGLFGASNGDDYYFNDPANCANTAAEFGHTTHEYSRPGHGSYCGTTTAGYYTIGNGDESTQLYLHSTEDINDNVQIYADVLLSHDVVRFNTGPYYFGTDIDSSSPFYYYEDPNLGGDLINYQHIFSPEEAGGLDNTTDKNTTNAWRATLGVQGAIGSSHWTYDLDMTYTEQKLTEHAHQLFTSAIESFFAPLFGPQLGFDPTEASYIYSPNYAPFYKPVTPAQYASFSGYADSYSHTEDSMLRAQLTDTALFPLPGGDAKLALLGETGAQGWVYAPDPRYLDGETYGYVATPGSGHRSRYAFTTELKLPVVKMLTVDASGRYDDYRVAGGNVDKFTYNLGLEFRPIERFLLRGRYGTAFKAPTLADEFQGLSGSFTQLTDYYSCAKGGYSGNNLGNCPQFLNYISTTTSGNTQLKPVTAKVWDFGAVWSPLDRMSISFDFMHWGISNEVLAQNPDLLLKTESLCRLGTYDISSPMCVAALAQVTRDTNGVLLNVFTPKINIADETDNAVILGANYRLNVGRWGEFELEASWSDLLKHTYQQDPQDPTINLLNDAIQSQDFKTKANVSLTWTVGPFSATGYVNRYGRSPNYLASVDGYGTPGAGDLSPWTITNLSARYQILKGLELSLAVDNVFNSMPPVDHSYPGTELQPYDEFDYNVYGRMYFLEANYKFGK